MGNSRGTHIGLVSARQDGSGNRYLEIGVNPTYGFAELTEVGIQIYKLTSGLNPSVIELNSSLVTAPTLSVTGTVGASGAIAPSAGISVGSSYTRAGARHFEIQRPGGRRGQSAVRLCRPFRD
jgi:hypothetical protein